MSVSSEISRLTGLRNTLRTKTIALGLLSDSSADLDDCVSAIDDISTKTAATITPGTIDKTISAGQYLTGAQTIKGDPDLISENIIPGVTIFGVQGSASLESLSDFYFVKTI